ncbi:MAG: HAD family hydrolase [Pseudomonadota bacterium]|nr:HAD family hydrolase [Pseudomonadota bacterium]
MKDELSKPEQNTLALVYDFDGTLTPQPMQEYTVLPELELEAEDFWKEVDEERNRTGGDPILTYMRLLIEKIEERKAHLSRDSLRKLATLIEYYPGVETWFNRINKYVAEKSNSMVDTRHYIVSAGLGEILEGISIKKFFRKIYASQYYFDHHEVARFPTTVINDTAKTQYLFRINKGLEETSEDINSFMPEVDRPIPFRNMLYIGDGLTDVPSMSVVKNYGGYAIAVHKPNDSKTIGVCRQLLAANRIDFFSSADYSHKSDLEHLVHKVLDLMLARAAFEKERVQFTSQTDRQIDD